MAIVLPGPHDWTRKCSCGNKFSTVAYMKDDMWMAKCRSCDRREAKKLVGSGWARFTKKQFNDWLAVSDVHES